MDDYEFGYSPDVSGFESFNYDGSDFSGFDGLNIDSLFSSGGIDAGGLDLGSMGGNFNLDDFLTELSGMGTDLGPASSMGMDQGLLDLIGLGDLGGGSSDSLGLPSTRGVGMKGASVDSLFGSSGQGGTDNTKTIVDALTKIKTIGARTPDCFTKL